MPQVITISDAPMPASQARKSGMLAPKTPAPKTVPLRSLRTDVKISEITRSQLKRFADSIRTAKIQKAISGIRLALVALANGRFEEAGNIAINSAVEATAANRQNKEMAARIVTTARGIVRNAIKGIMARSV